MLVRLMYASRAAAAVDQEELQSILRQCKTHNPAQGITGLLCMCFESRVFIQVLEGGRSAVNRLYNRIAADSRHTDVEVLSYEEIDERRFAGWSMGMVNMAVLNPALLLKYSPTARLDPFSVSGRVSMALFEELVATASIMGDRP
jgi:Sensors of blue-light using FAD